MSGSSEQHAGRATETIGLPSRPRLPAEPQPHLPDYRFVKVIGRGAFGTVWLAEETLAGVYQAVKVLHPASSKTRHHPKPTDQHAKHASRRKERPHGKDAPQADGLDPWASTAVPNKDATKRIERELAGIHAYQAHAKDHPHLVRILKTGLCELGEPARSNTNIPHSTQAVYYVMEIADHAGGAQPHPPNDYQPLTLDTLLRQKGRLPITLGRETLLDRMGATVMGATGGLSASAASPAHLPAGGVINIAICLLDAIDHLHKAGLHHRDVKPSNVLFVGGVLKLADMGLTASDDSIESVGTPGYLPPAPRTKPPDPNRARKEAVSDQSRARKEAVSAHLQGPTQTDREPLADARGSDQQHAGSDQSRARKEAVSARIPEPAADIRPFGPPDDLYALGKVIYVMTTGLNARDFPEWPADLDPTGDPKRNIPPEPHLATIRALINDLCHPDAEKRLSSIRETRRRLTGLAAHTMSPTPSRRRVALLVVLAAALGLAIGGGGMKWWYDHRDPGKREFARPPYDGSVLGQELSYGGRRFSLLRQHGANVEYAIGNQTVLRIWDLQTRLHEGRFEVAGAFQVYNTGNSLPGEITARGGEIDQVYLLAGDKTVLLYHGQQGPAPGIVGRFGRAVRLDEIAPQARGRIQIGLTQTARFTPQDAERDLRIDTTQTGNCIEVAVITYGPEPASQPAASDTSP